MDNGKARVVYITNGGIVIEYRGYGIEHGDWDLWWVIDRDQDEYLNGYDSLDEAKNEIDRLLTEK